jgi:hypothetical protein
MSVMDRKLFADWARMTALMIGCSLCLVAAGTAIAQTGQTKQAGSAPSTGGSAAVPACENRPQADWLINPSDPGPADARAILKLIHRYNWALDDHDFGQLDGLFTDDVFYELCDAAGEQILKRTDKGQLEIYLGGVFDELGRQGTQTRHIQSNALLNSVDTDTIQGKTSLAVTLQHPDIETPVLDYTGEFRPVFRREGGVWKFSRITLITDGRKIEFRAR